MRTDSILRPSDERELKDGHCKKGTPHACGCCHSSVADEHHHGNQNLIAPLCSLILFVCGMILTYFETSWFQIPIVRLGWYLVAFVPVGLPVFHEAWEAFQKKDFFNEFSLMLLASVGAFCIGEYPEAVAVMLFYTIGELFQHRAVDRAKRDISNLLDVRPETVRVFRNGEYIVMAPEQVSANELIEVLPGGRVPLDGVLTEDEAMFDTSALTGESLPRTVNKDSEVLAGMIVLGQTVHLRVSRLYHQSALARILALVQDASERKAPAELFIRRFARVYTPIVTLLAVLLVLVPAFVGMLWPSFHYVFSEWLYRGLVFLVISCPCALVVSVPLSYFAGIGKASRLGILFKGGNFLDAITQVDSIAFDKTGTLTTGHFEVTEIYAGDMEESDLLRIVSSVEQGSTHPIATAIVTSARRQGIIPDQAACTIREHSGYGLEAVMDGRQVLVGQVRFLERWHIPVPEKWKHVAQTVVVCAVNGKFVGALILSDTLKEDAFVAIKRLKALGIRDLAILSGDRQELVTQYADRLGIHDAYGNLLPEDKARYIERQSSVAGKNMAFVGDGLNDAPVLALSHVGIVMGGLGSDAAIESADVVIQTDQPSKVATAIRVGRYTRKIVRQNIGGAIGVKVLVLLAGALGYASLWGAVFADVGVALLAVLNAMRIFGKKLD